MESNVASCQLVSHIRAMMKHAATGAGGAATRPSRVPRMTGTMCPWLRAGEQTSELVVDVARSEEVMRAASAAMCFSRQVPQNAVD